MEFPLRVPERKYWGAVRDLDRLILSFVSQLSGLIIKYGGQVVHGTQPLITPILAEQVRNLAKDPSCLTLIASQLFGTLPEVAARAVRITNSQVILTPRIGSGDFNDIDTRNRSLTALRMTLAQEIDVLVTIGGKLHDQTAVNPGILEELSQARWQEVPCFIVASFGGAAGKLEEDIIEEFSRGNLLGSLDAKNSYGRPTPLEISRWSDTIDEYVGKLLVHLMENRSSFIRHQHIQRVDIQEYHISSNEMYDGIFLADWDKTKQVNLRLAKVNYDDIEKSGNFFAQFRMALANKDIDQIREVLKPDKLQRQEYFGESTSN